MSGDLKSHLESIRAQHGELTRRHVVDEAQDPTHPLHSRFEWDNAIAGDAYRLWQAGELIRSVRITYKDADEAAPARSMRAYISLPNDSGQAYEPAEEVAQDPLKRQMALNAMQREWKALYNRYQEFEEFLEMVRQDVFQETLAEVA